MKTIFGRRAGGWLLLGMGLGAGILPAQAQSAAAGFQYLAGKQEADGSWASVRVRRALVTTEALRAMQAVGQTHGARSTAADLLEQEMAEDNDDRARRIVALAAEGRTVSSLVTVLLGDADPAGGWGLTPGYATDPLDTSLALAALASQPAGDPVLRPALIALLGSQRTDGGWPCTGPRLGDPDSEISCTAYALLALSSYRERYSLASEMNAATAFLLARRNPDGSFGPAGPDEVHHTALASLALVAARALGSEVSRTISFLLSRQQQDGSWESDPYPTALAVQALQALYSVPYCGDGAVNRPEEACDGGVPAGVSCEGIGFGAGTLTCSGACTLDTMGCSAPPACGDNLRNQPFEVCDGTDLAARTCATQGFASGTLACASDCMDFDVSGCNAAPVCGDGVINQPEEACDLSDLGGATCGSLGLGAGLLGCAADCSLDTRQCDAASVAIDNKGREFFVGFLYNQFGGANPQLHLTSDVPTQATIQYPAHAPSFVRSVSISPGAVAVINLPNAAHSGWTAGQVLGNAVRISAPEELSVYLVNREFASSDAAMALPVDALSTSYIVTTFFGSSFIQQDRSEFLVIAPFDDTTVTISSITNLRLPPPLNVAPGGVPFEVKLNRGQGFRGESVSRTATLTGTTIEADRPVAVLNGHICATIPINVWACDHIFEMAHPLRSWGTSALVANLPNRPGGSIYRIVAAEDGTQVRLDGVLVRTLGARRFFDVGPVAGSHVFTANHPIFVTQFMTGDESPGAIDGDPAMANMIPPDQYLDSYTFSTVGGGQFRSHFLSLITPATAIGSVLFDGVPIAPAAFSAIGSTGYSSAVLPISQGVHSTSSSEPHGITVEGFNVFDSYVYPGGARLEIINPHCGDGRMNRTEEECDGSDLGGATCAGLGFSGGSLRCSADCQVDKLQCSGIGLGDQDGDGFPAGEDCDDQSSEVSPASPELPGNGADDDCNPGTPDAIPPGTVSCGLLADQLSYSATDHVGIEAAVENASGLLSLIGLTLSLEVAGEAPLHSEARALPPLPPGARAEQSFSFPVLGSVPGSYQAHLTVRAGGSPVAECSAVIVVDSTAATGAGLAGRLSLDPDVVDAGESSAVAYTVENRGNAPVDLNILVVILSADSGAFVGELSSSAALAPGGTFSRTLPLTTEGLSPRDYLVLLIAELGGTGSRLTLDSAVLSVVNAPPDCAGAVIAPSEVWPPNHRLVPVSIEGITDPDGDPVAVRVTGVFQDEPVDEAGDGAFCPDAEGIESSAARLRAERSGQGDGRVYHVGFEAADGRGGKCEGVVRVCVPHDRELGCGDQGPDYESAVCP